MIPHAGGGRCTAGFRSGVWPLSQNR